MYEYRLGQRAATSLLGIKLAYTDENNATSIKDYAPAIAALGTGAIAAPLLYKYLRKFTPSKNPRIRAIQEAAEAAKGKYHRTIPEEDPGSWWGRLLDKLRFDVDKPVYTAGPAPSVPKKVKGVVRHLDPQDARYVVGDVNVASEEATQKALRDLGYNKWDEYKFFEQYAPGSMAKTENIKDVMQELGLQPTGDAAQDLAIMSQLQDVLRKRYGKGFVMKNVTGEASGGLFPSEKDDFSNLLKGYRESDIQKRIADFKASGKDDASEAWTQLNRELKQNPYYSGSVLDELLKNPERVIVQERLPLEKANLVGRIGTSLLDTPPSQEIRVHVERGTAVPELTMGRFDPMMGVLHGRDKLRAATEYAQNILNKLPEDYRNQAAFAMDIAPLEGGGFKMIESNPGGYSGMLWPEGHPMGPYKLRQTMTGRWSPTVAGGGAALGSLGLGGIAGAGTAGYNYLSAPEDNKPPTPLAAPYPNAPPAAIKPR